MRRGFLGWILVLALLVTSCGLDDKNFSGESQKESSVSEENSEKYQNSEGNSEGGNSEKTEGTDVEDVKNSEDTQNTEDNHNSEDSSQSDDVQKDYTYTDLNKTMWSTTSLNVRTEPDKNGVVIGCLEINEMVSVTGQCNETGWYRIDFNGKTGYASDKYLVDENPIEETETDIIQTTMYATMNVNVRSQPNTSGKVLGVLQTNESITALGDAVDGWQKVLYEGVEAYVSAKYLSTEYILMHPEITAKDIVIPELNGDSPVIVIDAGHQEFANTGLEPIGPGSTKTKKKVSRGTYGSTSEWWEYELNLVVAMKLKEELLSRGYQVVMIRETHAINISNSERAMVANNINADAFVRIHANGSTNTKEQGAFTICQTPNNIYNGDKYESFRRLSECILNGFAASTGCVKLDVWETDTMSGINWAQVPTTILEMGYMTNPTEDALMATEEYQDKMVDGIADGLDMFFQAETNDLKADTEIN